MLVANFSQNGLECKIFLGGMPRDPLSMSLAAEYMSCLWHRTSSCDHKIAKRLKFCLTTSSFAATPLLNDIQDDTLVCNIFSQEHMTGFITWPYQNYYNYIGDQVTKPVILVKILLYVIQGVIDKVTSWPQLITKLLVAPT